MVQIIPITTILKNRRRIGDNDNPVQIIPITTILKNDRNDGKHDKPFK